MSAALNESDNQGNTDVSDDLLKFVGTWQYELESDLLKYTFFSDGTYLHESTNGTYEITGGKLVLHGQATLSYDYSFYNNDNTLNITLVGTDVTTVLTRE